MRKSMHRALSLLLAVVMVFGLLPRSFTFASAQDDSEKFSCTDLTASADKELMPEGPIEQAPFFSVIGKVTKRWKEGKGVTSVEVDKACGGAIAFTLNGAAKVEVVMSSTGGSNTSAVGVINAEGELMSNAEEILTVTGTDKITLTYHLEAGTYRVVSPADEANNRGARLYSVEVTMLAAAAETEEHMFAAATMTAAADKEAVAEGALTEDGYFSIGGKVKKRTDNNTGEVKSVEIEKNESGCISFTVAGSATMKMTVSSTGSSNVSAVALLDADGNVVANAEGITEVSTTAQTELSYTLEAGTYRIVSPQSDYNRGVRVYDIHVTETVGAVTERTAWEDVAAPVISSVVQNGGDLDVSVDMVIGYNGADSVTVSMLDEQGNALVSKTSTEEGRIISFTPVSSGNYYFTVVAKRGNESEKIGKTEEATAFVLPLSVPAINLIHQGANGALTVIWSASREATAYEITRTAADGSTVSETVEARQYTFEGLTVGEKYDFSVVALRGEERSAASETVSATAAAEASTAWSFSRYGDSTDDKNNGYIINDDGSVTVYSEGGKGKIQPASTDGLAFYYTAVPTDENFTLRVNVHVDSWKFSNGQDGFGILATDRLGPNGSATSFWTNQYMLGLSKIEYRWDSESETVYDINSTEGMKFSMKLGLGAYAKTGLTPEALDYMGTSPAGFKSVSLPMEFTATQKAINAGTYNIVGNAKEPVEGTLVELTDFVLEIQKNNTGYFLSYYDEEGNLIHREKNYDPNALSVLDSEFVYVGFFASRNAHATFTVQEFSTIKASEDAPAEEKQVTVVTPEVTISSAKVAQSENYTLTFMANVDGTASIRINDKITDMKDIPVKANELVSIPVSVVADDITSIAVYFKPDPEQHLGEDTVLSGTGTISTSVSVTHTSAFAERTNLYVAPDGFPTGDGSRKKPLDIYTAVDVARPGQTIILTEGTYLLENTVRIQRGVDGTQDAYIRMIADPEALTRPVLDFQGLCAGIVHGGNYWLFSGFDVTNSKDKEKGFQVSGSNNILQDIVAHHNGNTGIQISRLSGKTDLTIESWPANNLVLNCTSYANADSGCEDADGFAAKLTCGEGNVFDGCVAYNNADDGWDLFAKVETGPIGSVTIRNCVAYNNGYLEDGSKAGNGNGFKMGGASITGKHRLINSVAFNNKAKGIDSNSCPDIIVENCISYNNGSYNVAFYTNVEQDTAFKASGLISFKDGNCESVSTGENLKPRGMQNESDYRNDSCYYWNGTACVNASGVVLTADIFASTKFEGLKMVQFFGQKF